MPAPDASDFLCGNWVWDPLLRELRYYQRSGRGWKEEPEAVERLRQVRSVTWHRWSQAPMQSATGQPMPSRLSRIVVAFEGGGDLTISENDRECAGKLARAIAEAYGVEVVETGAPGRRPGAALPARDEMGRLVQRSGRTEVVVDEAAGEIVERRRRFPLGKRERRILLAEVRRLEVGYEVKGLFEVFTLWAVVGPEEERVLVASRQGYEGWAEPVEWRAFAEELGRGLGVEVSSAQGTYSG